MQDESGLVRGVSLRSVLSIVALLSVSACGDKTPAGTSTVSSPVEVSVITVQPSKLPLSVELPGRTAAFASAEIRPQVGGIVLERLFAEGGEVKAGQVLYRIDPAAARSSVASAKASLASALAGLASAKEKAVRYRDLVAIEAVSRESADEAQAAFEQSEAQVSAARAELDSAKLSLGYTEVKSPINGRIGRSHVSVGALVTADQATALAMVQQLDPIYVDATQSAAEMLRFRREMAQGRVRIAASEGPSVRLTLEDGSAYSAQGRVLLAEAIVEETAGTMTLRAQFPNPQRDLLPGMYVRMRLEGAEASDRLTVPQTAVSRDAKGNALVFVVGADGTLEQRSLLATQAVDDQWVVDSGLKAGEQVVVEGTHKLRAGMKVKAALSAAAAKTTETSTH